MKKRREQFSEELCAICYEYFKQQEDFDEEDSQYDTKSIRDWPSHFDIETVPIISETELKPKPLAPKTESVGSYLSRLDVG